MIIKVKVMCVEAHCRQFPRSSLCFSKETISIESVANNDGNPHWSKQPVHQVENTDGKWISHRTLDAGNWRRMCSPNTNTTLSILGEIIPRQTCLSQSSQVSSVISLARKGQR